MPTYVAHDHVILLLVAEEAAPPSSGSETGGALMRVLVEPSGRCLELRVDSGAPVEPQIARSLLQRSGVATDPKSLAFCLDHRFAAELSDSRSTLLVGRIRGDALPNLVATTVPALMRSLGAGAERRAFLRAWQLLMGVAEEDLDAREVVARDP